MKRVVLTTLLLAALLIGVMPAHAQDAPAAPAEPDKSKPQIYLPAINGANDEANNVREVPRASDADIAKSLGLTGQVLDPTPVGVQAAYSAVNVVANSMYGEVIGDYYHVYVELENTDNYLCAGNVLTTIRVNKVGGGYVDFEAGMAELPLIGPRKKAPLHAIIALSSLGGAGIASTSIVGIVAWSCETSYTYRYINVTGTTANISSPFTGTQYSGIVTNTAGFAGYVYVTATSYVTGTHNIAGAGFASTSSTLASGSATSWTGQTPGSGRAGFSVTYQALVIDFDTPSPNSWWDWSSGTTAKRTAGYNPGGGSGSGKFSLMSAYGEKFTDQYVGDGGLYWISAMLRNNSTVAPACYVKLNVRIYHNDNSYQTFTGVGAGSTEGFPPNTTMPVMVGLLGSQITGGLSNVSGYAITGGGANECYEGASFDFLPTTNTSKTLQGNGDTLYAGTFTNNTPRPTSNLTGAYAVLNSNGSIRFASWLDIDGSEEEGYNAQFDAFTSHGFTGWAWLHTTSPTLNNYNTSYYLVASRSRYSWSLYGSSPYKWSVPVPNGITVESDAWSSAMVSNGNGTFTTYYNIVAKVTNNTGAWACDITLNSMLILDTGYFSPGDEWQIPSTYDGHSLQKCIPPGESVVINNTIPRNATPQHCCFSYYVLGGTYTLSTGPVAVFTPINTAASFVNTGGYYTATVTNNTAYTYTQVYADADIYEYPTTSKIKYGLPLTSTDTLFTPGESIQVTGRNWVIGINASNPTYFRAQALP